MVWAYIEKRRRIRIGKRVMAMEVPGNRRRGRPKRRWLDNIKNDLSERKLFREDAQEQNRTETLFDKNTYELHRFQLPHIVRQRKYIQKHEL